MTQKKSSEPTDRLRAYSSTHDSFFREIFELVRIAQMFLKKVLPTETLDCLDLEHLTVEKRFLKDNLFKEMAADVVYRVPIRNTKDHVDFFVVLEHKSQPYALTIFQLWGYVFQLCYRIFQTFEKAQAEAKKKGKTTIPLSEFRLPPMIAIIIYHGKTRFTSKTELAELFAALPGIEKYLPHMQAILFDLSEMSDDDPRLNDPETLELNIVLIVLKTIFSEELPLTLPELLLKLKPLSDDPEMRRVIRAIWIYLSSRARYMKRNFERIFDTFQELLSQGEGDENNMSTMIEIWEAEGIAKGIAKGKAEGRAEDVIRILVRRWNSVPQSLTKQIRETTDIEKLDELFDFALDCRSLDEFTEKL